MKILHSIRYYNDKFECEWKNIEFPFRIMVGDIIPDDLLDELQDHGNENTTSDEWIDFVTKIYSFKVVNVAVERERLIVYIQ